MFVVTFDPDTRIVKGYVVSTYQPEQLRDGQAYVDRRAFSDTATVEVGGDNVYIKRFIEQPRRFKYLADGTMQQLYT